MLVLLIRYYRGSHKGAIYSNGSYPITKMSISLDRPNGVSLADDKTIAQCTGKKKGGGVKKKGSAGLHAFVKKYPFRSAYAIRLPDLNRYFFAPSFPPCQKMVFSSLFH